jgi:hypothetical protein
MCSCNGGETLYVNTPKPRIYPKQPTHKYPHSPFLQQKPEDPVEQPAAQMEVLAMNTLVPNTQPKHQHQETKTQEDLQQDSEEEIEAIIEDELVRLHQENERL